jgi:hypothetical protein
MEDPFKTQLEPALRRLADEMGQLEPSLNKLANINNSMVQLNDIFAPLLRAMKAHHSCTAYPVNEDEEQTANIVADTPMFVPPQSLAPVPECVEPEPARIQTGIPRLSVAATSGIPAPSRTTPRNRSASLPARPSTGKKSRNPHAAFLGQEGTKRLPPKYKSSEAIERLQYLNRFLIAHQAEQGATLRDVHNELGLSVLQCNEMLNCLIKLGHIERKRAEEKKSSQIFYKPVKRKQRGK